jgi:tetratricopeptide (TPR) repeat protein
MKNFKYSLLILTLFGFMSSCQQEFLELYPETSINSGNFYKSTVDFQQALVGAYVPLRDISNTAFFLDEMRSDNTHYDYNPQDRGGLGYEQLADFMEDSQNGVVSGQYQGNYKGISRVNVILDHLASINFEMADVDKKQITGEAKALRAHYYYDLVRHFGGVPLHLHEVTTKEGSILSRSTETEVYAQIISDFTEAIDNLALPKPAQETGRITKGMAASELGMVYMTLGQFDKAAPLFESVKSMGYSLWPNYSDAFLTSNQNKKESIFEVQYKDGTDGQSSNFIYRFIPIGSTINILGIASNNTSGGWNIPSDDLINSYENGDQRLDASIGIIEGTVNASNVFTATRVYPSTVRGYSAPSGTIAKYFVKKYFHLPYGVATSGTKENWPIIRYSKVLLSLAESYNEIGNPGLALQNLNIVRNRAGLNSIVTVDPTALRSIIAKERRVELAFENSRWFDLVRTKEAISKMNLYGATIKAKYSYILPSAYNITENKYLYPIPFRELSLNTKLTQNPGY